MLLGKTQLPDWFSHGVKEKSLLFTCKLDSLSAEIGLLYVNLCKIDPGLILAQNDYGPLK